MNAPRTRSRWRSVAAVTFALLLASIATGGARADEPQAVSGAPAREAMLPGRALASRLGLPPAAVQLQARLDARIAQGGQDCRAAYQAHKAQAWLNFTAYAAQNDVPAPVRAAALHEAAELIGGLETRAPGLLQTAELPGSRHVRDDLWRGADAVRADGRWCAEPRMAAYCEVQLAWVGYEATAGGWRHVDPYVRIAEDYCATARNAVPMRDVPMPDVPLRAAAPSPSPTLRSAPVMDVAPRVIPAAAPVVEPPPVANPAPAAVRPPPPEPSISVHFPHNRSKRGDIRRPGRQQLARLAKRLRSLPLGMIVTVTGHADITGHSAYNEALSAKRAQSVVRELEMRGVDPSRIRIGAAGSTEPLVKCLAQRHRRRYLSCLEPNRRVVVQLARGPD